MPERRTALYDLHLRTASRMVAGGGDYLFPFSYTSPVEEHLNTRTNLGLQDLSSMGQVDVKGPGAERLLNRLLVNELRDLHPGQVRYSTLCNQEGGIVDDVTVYKFHDEHFMVVTSSGPRLKTARWIDEHARGMSTYVTEVSAAIALLSLQGPRSRDLLAQVATEVELGQLTYFRFHSAHIHDTRLLLSRTGYTGELGYELYVPADEAAGLWEFLLRSGQEFGLRPYGVQAMQSLRIEKAYPLYGPDMDERHTPFHLGLNRWIRFDKRQFIGREALLQVQEIGLEERWTGLILEGEQPAAHGDPIFSIADVASWRRKMTTGSEAGAHFDQEQPGVSRVGVITSSARGHTVGRTLALGHLRTSHSWPGARLLVVVNGRPTLATVAPTPFFDAEGIRQRAKGPRSV